MEKEEMTLRWSDPVEEEENGGGGGNTKKVGRVSCFHRTEKGKRWEGSIKVNVIAGLAVCVLSSMLIRC